MTYSRLCVAVLAVFVLSNCNRKDQPGLREPAAAGMRSTSQAQRWAARQSQALQTNGVTKQFAGVDPNTAQFSPLSSSLPNLAAMSPPGARPDFFGVPNYANSALPEVFGSGAYAVAVIDTTAGSPTFGQVTAVNLAPTPDGGVYSGAGFTTAPTVSFFGGGGLGAQATAVVDASGVITGFTLISGGSGYLTPPSVRVDGAPVPGTGIRKFVDTLAGLCAVSGPNNLGQCLPIALKADAGAGRFTDSDYYEIELSEYTRQLHSDLPPTRLRGYADLNGRDATGALIHQYLGPVIIAERNRPVRIRFVNNLPVGVAGELFIPVDRTYMGAGLGPDGTPYAENRADLHLHGGNSPWVSDGTPHQWITPAGESAYTNFTRGLSARDVPDMVDGGVGPDGEMTYYWTNQQSGRLIWYHDHSYGITRLNVYTGEAAPVLLVDPLQEQQLELATVPGTFTSSVTDAGVLGPDLAHVLPLVLQDKSFVPDDGVAGGQLAATDPTWNLAKWGGRGQLWYPHIYTPNQNPADTSGASAYGRWDYGPWFWPAQNPATFVADGKPYPCSSIAFDATTPVAFPPLMCPGVPLVAGTPEAFMDTSLVNGTAYPTATIEPAAYRFQVLNAANDRAMSLSLFYAATKDGVVCRGGAVADLSTCTEVSMVPAVPHLPLCSSATTLNCLCNGSFNPTGCTAPAGTNAVPLCDVATEMGGGGLAVGDTTGGTILNGTGLPANCWPTLWPTDARAGGVPDPTTAGPALVQLGTEGGLLAQPAVIPAMPVNYEYNRRSITVLNIFTHALLLGPAERSDMVVDFSSVPPNSALILYNDSPAPVPAIDPRVDYYTGGPDNSVTGGAPSTMPGFGPNTRTLMQFKVQGASTNRVPFSYAALAAAQPAIFAATQDRVIVPQPHFPAGNGQSPNDTYVRIQDTSVSYFDNGAIGSVTLTNGGSGYTTAPAVTIDPPTGCVLGSPGCVQATATAIISGSVATVTLQAPARSTVYLAPPTVTFSGGGGAGAVATASLVPTRVQSIAITPANTIFNSVPTVTISPPCVGCASATAQAFLNANGTLNRIVVTNPVGPLYSDVPIVTVSGGNANGVSATARLVPSQLFAITVTDGGSGYSTAPTVAISLPFAGPRSRAISALGPMSVTSVVVPNGGGGQGYTQAPNVTISGGGGAGATAIASGVTRPILPKTIQELFTLDYGRMNATLGVELPFTNFLTQTTIPYGYTDPTTELVKDNETQFWKITHNGVDTHFIHFHLFTVQLINRVGWDGAIKPPDQNELGWKDTVRMNPLEDIIVAIRPMNQSLPWRLPNSIRPLDVTKKVGTSLPNQFTNVDPNNNPVTVVNDLTNFGAEYIWHCHILGHEENDMMRAISFVVAPDAPTAVAATGGRGVQIVVGWTDNAINETGFTVERALLDPATNLFGPWAALPPAGGVVANEHVTVRQNVTQYRDPSARVGSTYKYRVTANNVVGYTRTFAAPAQGYEWQSGDSAPVETLPITR